MIDISEKYNLMKITEDKLDQIGKNAVGPNVHVGLLYGMPVILYLIGKNTAVTQSIVSDLSKYNHPYLALNYGFYIDNDTKVEDYKEADNVYIVRELVKGKNFHNITAYDIHDRLVLLYKLICLLEFLHSFGVYYLFLHPSKIIITDDLEIKVVDHIKVNEDVLSNINLQSLNDETRFICPELFNATKLEGSKNEDKQKIDLFSFGCILFYSVTGELPWSTMENKQDIYNCFNQNKEVFLKSEEHYPEEIKKVYGLIDKLLNLKVLNTEEVRVEMEKLPEIIEYNKNGTLKFDFEAESKKVVENIEMLINEIDKLYDDSQIPKHYNSIHQPNSKLKFFNQLEIDKTKPKVSLVDNKLIDLSNPLDKNN